jgi:MFS family permease
MELKNRQRFFLSAFFFLSGFCFSTWASRIPDIKTIFGYNEAELGTILLCMPISSMIGLPVSSFLVSRYDSRIPLIFAFGLGTVALFCIGISATTFALVSSICLFAFSLRIINISINTQAITLQKQFEKRINGAFHGLWSTGGIVGVGFSTLMVALDISRAIHIAIVSLLTLAIAFYSFQFLLKNDRAPSGNKLVVGKPDPYIVYLGLMVFVACVCEGGMFDWSGIYFKEVVKVEVFTLGYLLFMILMATSRFASDRIVENIGMQKTYILSGVLIIAGIALATIFPYFWPSLIGFCLVGFGTGSVIPMTYSLAGASTKYSPGMAVSIIATYGIVGMLIGPPMIGYLAHAFHLRISFIAFGISGLLLIPLSGLFFSYRNKTSLKVGEQFS